MARQGIFVLAFLSTILSFSAADSHNFVKEVTQNYTSAINDLVAQQITKELEASYIYQAYASYFQRADVALPGVKKFFSEASLEERGHAQMLIDYINERGGNNKFENIQLKTACQTVQAESDEEIKEKHAFCICYKVASYATYNDTCKKDKNQKQKNALFAFHDALLIERYVNRKLLDLHKMADENGDAHLAHMVEHHFLGEQVEAINQLAQYITRLESFNDSHYELGEYLFDQRLK